MINFAFVSPRCDAILAAPIGIGWSWLEDLVVSTASAEWKLQL